MASQKGAPLPEPWGVLYVTPNDTRTPRICGNCIFWAKDDNRCLLHPPDVETVINAVCGYHVSGDPVDKWQHIPGINFLEPKLSGLEVTKNGTWCQNCRYYEPKTALTGLCHAMANHKTEEPPVKVQAEGCCARWNHIP